MRGRADNLHAAGREIDPEHGVVRDEARQVQTSVVKKSAAAITPHRARRKVGGAIRLLESPAILASRGNMLATGTAEAANLSR